MNSNAAQGQQLHCRRSSSVMLSAAAFGQQVQSLGDQPGSNTPVALQLHSTDWNNLCPALCTPSMPAVGCQDSILWHR